VIFSLGISPSVILSTDLIVGSVPPERSGSAASLSETSAELGGALGIAILGSIGTALYRNIMASENPEGISSTLKAQANETLGGAVAAAEQLPNTTKNELLASSQQAFTQAFELNGLISVAIAIGIALVIFTLLGKAQPEGKHI
jgi:MFS transporter, DHA2 family, multidrug resistance protein